LAEPRTDALQVRILQPALKVDDEGLRRIRVRKVGDPQRAANLRGSAVGAQGSAGGQRSRSLEQRISHRHETRIHERHGIPPHCSPHRHRTARSNSENILCIFLAYVAIRRLLPPVTTFTLTTTGRMPKLAAVIE